MPTLPDLELNDFDVSVLNFNYNIRKLSNLIKQQSFIYITLNQK